MKKPMHSRRFFQPAGLPSHKNAEPGGYLYAFEFTDGSVKVGVTWNPAGRAQSLKVQYRKSIVRAQVAPCRGRSRYLAERAALEVVGRLGTKSKVSTELFHGLKFGDAANAIKQMARREFVIGLHATAFVEASA